jgi:hypothetical protein
MAKLTKEEILENLKKQLEYFESFVVDIELFEKQYKYMKEKDSILQSIEETKKLIKENE